MQPINPLTGIPPVSSPVPRSGERPHEQLPAQPGQLFKALIVEARPENRFIIDIGGNRLLAESRAPLAPGQTLQLQVTATTPQIELKIVAEQHSPFFGKSITLLGKPIDITALYQSLQQKGPLAMASLTPATRNVLSDFAELQQRPLSGDESGTILKQLIDRLGMSLERLLAAGDKEGAGNTLKAALLEMSAGFKGADAVAEHTAKILTTLELFQLAQVHLDGDRQFLFPLPLPFIEQGFLLVDNQGREGEPRDYDSDEIRFSLHLSMSDIGHLRIEFFHTADGLYVRFHADSPEKSDFIARFSDELKQTISEVPLLSLTFAGDAGDPVGELMRLIVPPGQSVVDTTV